MHSTQKKVFIFCCLCLPSFLFAQNFGGNPASVKWMQVNTPAARVIFPKGMDSQAIRISNITAMLDTATLHSIGDKVRKWNIVLQNQNTEGNAYVRLAPVISELYMIPPQNNFNTGSLRWDDNLVIHENRHMQQLGNFNHGLTKLFSFFLGQEGQLLANGMTIPDYFFEGDAVWQETLVSKQGRGRMPSFFNGMRSLWLADKKYSWMKLRSGSLRHYTPDHYELGYQLVAYGYEKYGADFWRMVTGDAVRFKGLFYSFNKAIEKYSGKTYTQFCQDALNYFKTQTLNTAGVKKYEPSFITGLQKNNVVDYLYPQYVSDDTLIVTKQSYKELNAFYFLIHGKEKKIRVKDFVTDDYFSYRNGKLVYAAYQSDPRWGNRNYSVIQLLDVHSNEQRQLSFKSRYFSPDINAAGTEVIAVNVNTDGSNYLHRLDATTGELISQLPNPFNYFFTQTKYVDNNTAVSAVRHPDGRMALIKVNLQEGSSEPLTNFTYNVLGYPSVKGDTVFFSMSDAKEKPSLDKVFALNLKTKKLFTVSNNLNGVYSPSVNGKGDIVVSSFTAGGSRLEQITAGTQQWVEAELEEDAQFTGIAAAASQKGALSLYSLKNTEQEVKPYRKSFQLFNFHSARPFADDPEYGYTFYSDNILTSFYNTLTYTYNRNEQSHAIAWDILYAGAFPYLRAGAEQFFNRKIDTGAGGTSFSYKSTKLRAGFLIPLNFINGRTFKYVNIGADFNTEYVPYRLVNRKTIETKALNYADAFFVFSNKARMARQHINPAWAQTLTVTYRNAFNIIDNKKLVADGSLFFPGLFTNHSLVIDGAFQKRDTLAGDFFSKTFAFSRGYQDLNQRRMYKVGVNYHFPLCYPDWGFGNIVFFQRIRANAFYDYTSSLTKFRSGQLLDIKSRSTGAEIYFDTKIWNALPVTVGVRYSRLLDTDLLNPGAVNRWEVTIPFSIIPD
ncbi:MAG: hypothetical protein QM791_08885 [Ferruginibacter sp.]